MATAVTCNCCLLKYEVPPKGSPLNQDGFCSVCKLHQSTEIHQSLKRATEHEAMLRERLKNYMRFAAEREAEAREVKQKNYFAYRSRDKVVGYLRKIADVHNMRPSGECICRSKNCRIAKILDDNLAQRLISDVDRVQRDMIAREQISREYRWYEDEEMQDVLRDQDLEYLASPTPVARKDETA